MSKIPSRRKDQPMRTAITKMVMWGHDEPDNAGAQPEEAEHEVHPALARHAGGADDLEEAAHDEEATGEVDRGVDRGVTPTDDKEAEDHRDDPSGQIPAPHLLELRGHCVTDGDFVSGEYVGHLDPLGE